MPDFPTKLTSPTAGGTRALREGGAVEEARELHEVAEVIGEVAREIVHEAKGGFDGTVTGDGQARDVPREQLPSKDGAAFIRMRVLQGSDACAPTAPVEPVKHEPIGARDVTGDAIYAITGNTGPLAEAIISKYGHVAFKAKPGAEITVRNLNALDGNDQPLALGTYKVSEKGVPPFQGPDYVVDTRFDLAGKGMNWMPGDTLAIHVKNPGEDQEAKPALFTLPNVKKGWSDNATREPFVKADRIKLDSDGAHSTAAHAVPAFGIVRLLVDGARTNITAQAGPDGQFFLDVPHKLRGYALSVEAQDGNARLGAQKPAVAPLSNATTATSGLALFDRLQTVLRDHLQHATAGTRFAIEGVPPGTEVSVSVDGEARSFKADQEGVLFFDLPRCHLGSDIRVSSEPLQVFEPGTWALPKTARDVFGPMFQPAPDGKGAGRILEKKLEVNVVTTEPPADVRQKELVQRALTGASDANLLFAEHIFGEHSPFPELRELRDPARIAAVFAGAVAGFAAKENSGAGREVIAKLKEQAKATGASEAILADIQKGSEIWRTDVGAKPKAGLELTFALQQRGQSSMRVVGGYNMLHPERSSNLRPEVFSTPNVYALDLRGPRFYMPEGQSLHFSFRGGEGLEGSMLPY